MSKPSNNNAFEQPYSISLETIRGTGYKGLPEGLQVMMGVVGKCALQLRRLNQANQLQDDQSALFPWTTLDMQRADHWRKPWQVTLGKTLGRTQGLLSVQYTAAYDSPGQSLQIFRNQNSLAPVPVARVLMPDDELLQEAVIGSEIAAIPVLPEGGGDEQDLDLIYHRSHSAEMPATTQEAPGNHLSQVGKVLACAELLELPPETWLRLSLMNGYMPDERQVYGNISGFYQQGKTVKPFQIAVASSTPE